MPTSPLWSWLHPNMPLGQGYFWPHYFSPFQTLARLFWRLPTFFSPTGLQRCIYISAHECASQKCPAENIFLLCTFFRCLIVQETIIHLPLAVQTKLYLCGCGGKKIELHSHHRVQKWVQITLWNKQLNPCSSSHIIADAWSIADGTAKAAYRYFFWRKQLLPK